ncbi:MAG: GTPase-associated system all-helical protein GASH, partial [Cyanobacteria bacterium J06600_6]
LESLRELAKENTVIAALIWLTARDVVIHYQLDLEENVIINLLQELANSTEESAQLMWGINLEFQANQYRGTDITISVPKSDNISEENLKNALLRAAQHTNWASYSQNIGDNPGNFNQNWAGFFSENAAKGIMREINSVLSHQSKSISAISTSIQKNLATYFAQLQPFFEDLNTSLSNSITSNNKRSELLWWKQSLYSPLLNTSYRNANLLDTVISMVLDLSEQVNAIYPESVDYLLRETLKEVHGEQVYEERLLTDWLKDIRSLHKNIQLVMSEYALEGNERKSLLTAWCNIIQSDESRDLSSETGINKKAKLTASDLAVWLFHGAQAHKLATAK